MGCHPRGRSPRQRHLFPAQPELHCHDVPILPQEPDSHPIELLDQTSITDAQWWLVYTNSRQEKQLMRHLRRDNVSHYAPQIEQRRRSPSGRVRTTYMPLFSNYVFVCGDDESRYQAICSGCVQKATPIEDVQQLVGDLVQIRNLIRLGIPLTIESRIQPGQKVRIKTGAFAGYEGTVIRRENDTLILVSVRFMEQGVSAKLDDCQLEIIEAAPVTT